MIYLDHPYTLVDIIDYLVYDTDKTKSDPLTQQVQKVTQDDELMIKTLLTLHGDEKVCFNGKSLDPEKSEYQDITAVENLDLEIRKFKLTVSPNRSKEAEYIAPINLFLISYVSTNIAKQIKYYQDVEKAGGEEFVPQENFIDPFEACEMHWVDAHGIECLCLFRDEMLLCLQSFNSLHSPTGKYLDKFKKNSSFYNTDKYWFGEVCRNILEASYYHIIGACIFKHLPLVYTESESSFDITVYDDSNPDDPQDFTWHCTAIGVYAGIERALMVTRNINHPQASVLVRGLIFDVISKDPYAARNITKEVYYQVVQYVDLMDQLLTDKMYLLDFDILQARLAQLAVGQEGNSVIFKVHTNDKVKKGDSTNE